MKKFFALALVMIMALSLVACGAKEEAPAPAPEAGQEQAPAEKQSLTLATGGTSGTYYAVGGVMKTVLDAKLEKSSLNVESTGASVANVNMMTDGEAELAYKFRLNPYPLKSRSILRRSYTEKRLKEPSNNVREHMVIM